MKSFFYERCIYILAGLALPLITFFFKWFLSIKLTSSLKLIISIFFIVFVTSFLLPLIKRQYTWLKWVSLTWISLLLWMSASVSVYTMLITHQFILVSPLYYFMLIVQSPKQALDVSLLGAFVLIPLMYFFIREKKPNHYGDARFAKKSDIQKAGLFAKKGLRLGTAFGKTLISKGYEHVIVFAPTGSGKTTSIAIPNLMHWDESIIVSDIKLSLYAKSVMHREKMGHDVYRWNPGAMEGMTHCYNPLDLISEHQRIDDIQKIAAIFIPDAAHTDPIWNIQARFLFVALVLYVLDTDELSNTIHSVINLIKNAPDVHEWIIHVLESRPDLDALCRQNLMKFAELPEKTRLSIMATFLTHFELFDNPLIVHATSKSDFDIRKLRNKKMSIYVGVTNDNLVRFAPLLTIFYQQVADVLTRELPQQHEHGVLLLMDEFASLKKMESFQKNIGLFREYKVRVLIMVQELAQLYAIYGRDGAKVFINSKIRIAFAQNDEETCQLLASQLGHQTIAVKQRSYQLTNGAFNPSNQENIHYMAKPLLSAQEIRQLPADKALLLCEGYPALMMKKLYQHQ